MQQLTRSMPTRWALVLLIFTACLVPASVTSATPPGTNGRIAFMRHDDEGHWQIWTANPDMTAVDQITDGPYDNAFPVWSPDGRRLAFASTRSDISGTGAINDIFVMNADGTGVTQVSASIGWSSEPTWSPDGNLIAFHSDAGDWPTSLGLFVVHPDGTGQRRLTSHCRGVLPGAEWEPFGRPTRALVGHAIPMLTVWCSLHVSICGSLRHSAITSSRRPPEERTMDQPMETTSIGTRTLIADLRADAATAADKVARLTAEYEGMLSDQDTIQEDRDATAQLVAEARAVCERAETALALAEAGRYGRCQRCGSPIPKERLAALPDATTCVSCA